MRFRERPYRERVALVALVAVALFLAFFLVVWPLSFEISDGTSAPSGPTPTHGAPLETPVTLIPDGSRPA